MAFRVTGTTTQLFPTFRRNFSQHSAQAQFSTIKRTPSLEDVDASCVLQESHLSKKGEEYEIVLDFSVSPRRNTYKGQDIIQKKLEIDPHFRTQVESMKKLAYERLDKLRSFDPNDWVNPNWYLRHSLILNLIEKEPLIAKNGKRFECNAWVHNDYRQNHADMRKGPEDKLQTVQITDANKLKELDEGVASQEAMLPCFHPWVTPPSWLKDHTDTSLQFNQSVWKHPFGSKYEISIWVHSIPEDISKKGIKDLSLRIQNAGQPLTYKIEGLKMLAAQRLSQALELRKPPICIAAVKAAMIAEGTFPLCSDVHITEHDIFEISAHVSKQPQHEVTEVNEALKDSAKKSSYGYTALNGKIFFYRPIVGPAPDNVLEGMMYVDKRVEMTKRLIKHADEGYCSSIVELGWLAQLEEGKLQSDSRGSDIVYPSTFETLLADRMTPGDAISDESIVQGSMEEKK